VNVVNSVALSFISVSQRQPAVAAEAAAAGVQIKKFWNSHICFNLLRSRLLDPLILLQFILLIRSVVVFAIYLMTHVTLVYFSAITYFVQRFNSVMLQNSFVGDCHCSK
jgi:hypothetical protein